MCVHAVKQRFQFIYIHVLQKNNSNNFNVLLSFIEINKTKTVYSAFKSISHESGTLQHFNL